MPERATRVRYWVLVFTVTLAVITYIDRAVISVASVSIADELRLNTKQSGLIFTAFGVAYALFEIPGGFLGDWMGPRRVLLRIVLWWSFFTAATGWAWNFVSMVTARFLFGAGEAGCFPNLTKVFTTWLPERERVRAQGLMWLSARWGGAFTPPIAFTVIQWVGWRHAFSVFGVLGLIWAAAWALWFRDNPLQNPKMNEAERELLRPSSNRASGHSNVPWKVFAKSGRVWLLCWQYFFLSYGWYFYITWLPTYMRQARGMDINSTKWLAVLPLFLGGMGNPASVFLSERVLRRTSNVDKTRRIISSLGFAGAAACLVGSTFIGNAVWAMIAIATASFCNDLAMPPSWAAAMDMGGKYAGTLSGAMNTLGNLGGAAAPLAIGYVLFWTHNNWNLTFYMSAAAYVAGIMCWMFLDSVKPLEGTE